MLNSKQLAIIFRTLNVYRKHSTSKACKFVKIFTGCQVYLRPDAKSQASDWCRIIQPTKREIRFNISNRLYYSLPDYITNGKTNNTKSNEIAHYNTMSIKDRVNPSTPHPQNQTQNPYPNSQNLRKYKTPTTYLKHGVPSSRQILGVKADKIEAFSV
ncbi:hypothetical protein H6P81_014803 [Aristolochia fimbriata]|uniref:Uncharacterized protein n=1 Tax=Aristolochia fimbriata TaxID=158543 RepID=A0AAV7E877_ARIFI|nr:hypothetical protein H6P81_014803 [Aristolochia fimbriata]